MVTTTHRITVEDDDFAQPRPKSTKASSARKRYIDEEDEDDDDDLAHVADGDDVCFVVHYFFSSRNPYIQRRCRIPMTQRELSHVFRNSSISRDAGGNFQ